jgi:acyl-coenzyme A synthetase/AMP-(fatty) acid ligase
MTLSTVRASAPTSPSPRGPGRPASQELIQFARARVCYKAPGEIVVFDQMPLTATGKLDRTYLKQMAAANLARG